MVVTGMTVVGPPACSEPMVLCTASNGVCFATQLFGEKRAHRISVDAGGTGEASQRAGVVNAVAAFQPSSARDNSKGGAGGSGNAGEGDDADEVGSFDDSEDDDNELCHAYHETLRLNLNECPSWYDVIAAVQSALPLTHQPVRFMKVNGATSKQEEEAVFASPRFQALRSRLQTQLVRAAAVYRSHSPVRVSRACCAHVLNLAHVHGLQHRLCDVLYMPKHQLSCVLDSEGNVALVSSQALYVGCTETCTCVVTHSRFASTFGHASGVKSTHLGRAMGGGAPGTPSTRPPTGEEDEWGVCSVEYTPQLCVDDRPLNIVGETTMETAHGPIKLITSQHSDPARAVSRAQAAPDPAADEVIAVCRDGWWLLRMSSETQQAEGAE